MKYPWIDDYLLEKKGVTRDFQPVWKWIRYHVGGKMFAAVCLDDDDKPYYINLKLEPDEGTLMREMYEDIIPGYYSDKIHWNSVKTDGEVPDELLKDMLNKSYFLVLKGFSKKKQREILELTCCGQSCKDCELYSNICEGCNESSGKVFHAPYGKACPIYACSVVKHRYVSCGQCQELPCGIWRETRDPKLSDEEFELSTEKRTENLKRAFDMAGGEYGV